MVNLFDAVRAPRGAEWPYTLKKACLFAWFREGMGRVTFRFELSRLSDYELVAAPWQQVVEFTDPLRTTLARFLLPNVRFPMPGLYTFDIYANGEFLDDQRVRVVTTEAL